ncbi:MAG: hypothetical protein IJL74_03925 [Bacilli bacterium]|nr:hypothetical protein [Bacilli bacterium]
MNEILFLLFAFFTVFLSIKVSYYVDYLSKHSKLSGALLAGILLAGVTSLPEFVTCFSAIFVDNNLLAVGDILGSNIFNIFMISVFDLFFIKKTMFFNMNKSHNLIFILLLINYFVLYLFVGKLSFNLSFIGIPTLCILLTYGYYLYRVSFISEKKVKINDSSSGDIVLKLIITSLFMIFSSIVLTVLVNNLAQLHPHFSSSFLGSIFLGVTTSLPEVITCYALISMQNYDLALDDIIGSNFFNLLILAIGDLSLKGSSIFYYADTGVFTLIVLGLAFTFISFISCNKHFKKYYGLLSFIIVVIYLGYWIINFLG